MRYRAGAAIVVGVVALGCRGPRHETTASAEAAVLNQGFMVRLPRTLFRPIEFPAALRQSVAVEGNDVKLALTTGDLAITPNAVWYSVLVQAGTGAPAPSASPSPEAAPRP